MKPFVSAIITTHNRLPLLKRAIESVLTQTYSNIELIVVSDNSTDGTIEYCNARKDFHFINIPASESKGGNYARNLGIKAAQGEFVAFLDDDDYWYPEKIERQVEVAMSSQADFVACLRDFEVISEDGKIHIESEAVYSAKSGNYSKKVLLTCCVTTSSTMMIRRSALVDIGYFDESLHFWQDYELTIRLAQVMDFVFVPLPLVNYRVDKNDQSRLTNRYYDWWKAVKYIHSKHKKLYSQLSAAEKRKVKAITYRDARNRAVSCGLNFKAKLLDFKMKIWVFGEIIQDKMHQKTTIIHG